MNAVEIEEAVSRLAETPFDAEMFPFDFLEAFGNKPTTLKKLQSKNGGSNQSDLPGGVLQRNNIHLQVCSAGEVTNSLSALRDSPATTRYKAKFILATDGKSLEAENLVDGETIACDYPDFHDHFGFFLALAGITTVKQIRENAFDIKATGRLNRLYIELLKDNPEWDKADRREDLNHFIARLIFCFFAEDTNIFHSNGLFTATVTQMSASDAANTHEVISELFLAMSTPPEEREAAQIRNWANVFPYVNGGLFSASHDGSVEVPRFSKIARSYLLHVGNLDWTKINPDIFGSMIQAVADDEERGALGMHYTSVPNILKVLNPLFLDDLRAQLETAGDNARKLLNLRQRMARIRVFDPACGSGNFLVIAYKEMRGIEAEINRRRDEENLRTTIPLTNFRGIELRHFSAEIARLALVIAKFQCDVLYLGQQEARLLFLPLERDNWITCGNALRLDWLSVCPPTGTESKVQGEDLFSLLHEQAEVDFENEGGETYICGNPPYLGTRNQTSEQKKDIEGVLCQDIPMWRSLDYVSGWLINAARYLRKSEGAAAFVTTSSICQGSQVPILWGEMLRLGCVINFAHAPFGWKNLAAHNAGVTVIIVGFSHCKVTKRLIYTDSKSGESEAKEVENINSYLAPAKDVFVDGRNSPISLSIPSMDRGSAPSDDGNLVFEYSEYEKFIAKNPSLNQFFYRAVGGSDFIKGNRRFAIYISDESSLDEFQLNLLIPIAENVSAFRRKSPKAATKKLADRPLKFAEDRFQKSEMKIFIPQLQSGGREFIVCGVFPGDILTIAPHFDIPACELFPFALLSSRIHLVWIATVCGKLKTDFRYSNTLGWNTFPVPTLTDQNKTDLTRCAEDILLAREAHFPATIADLYAPDKMPKNLREAHDRNDEILERIYIGRRFKNDTERLEKLFELYTKMTSQPASSNKPVNRAPKGTK
jgi:hypothetical protein